MTTNEAKEIISATQHDFDRGEQELIAWISKRTIDEMIVIIEPLVTVANARIEDGNQSIKAFLSLYGVSKILELIAREPHT